MRRLALALLFALCALPAFATTIYLTSGTTWTVPADWNSQQNLVEIVAGGGAAGAQCASPTATTGGGGGAYSAKANIALTPGATVNIHFNVLPASLRPDVWFGSSTTVFAQGGDSSGNTCGLPTGGQASAGFGTVKFSGGKGSAGTGAGNGVGSGGGAAGPHGNGNDSPGPDSATGGSADAGFGGAAGVSGPGGNGTEWDASHGSGGGGGSDNTNTGRGGNYGGGSGYDSQALGFYYAPGIIRITYTPRNRVSSGVF